MRETGGLSTRTDQQHYSRRGQNVSSAGLAARDQIPPLAFPVCSVHFCQTGITTSVAGSSGTGQFHEQLAGAGRIYGLGCCSGALTGHTLRGGATAEHPTDRLQLRHPPRPPRRRWTPSGTQEKCQCSCADYPWPSQWLPCCSRAVVAASAVLVRSVRCVQPVAPAARRRAVRLPAPRRAILELSPTEPRWPLTPPFWAVGRMSICLRLDPGL